MKNLENSINMVLDRIEECTKANDVENAQKWVKVLSDLSYIPVSQEEKLSDPIQNEFIAPEATNPENFKHWTVFIYDTEQYIQFPPGTSYKTMEEVYNDNKKVFSDNPSVKNFEFTFDDYHKSYKLLPLFLQEEDSENWTIFLYDTKQYINFPPGTCYRKMEKVYKSYQNIFKKRKDIKSFFFEYAEDEETFYLQASPEESYKNEDRYCGPLAILTIQEFVCDYVHVINREDWIKSYSIDHLDRIKVGIEKNKQEALEMINVNLDFINKYDNDLLEEINHYLTLKINNSKVEKNLNRVNKILNKNLTN